MSIAVFIETYEPNLGAQRRQALLVPHEGAVRVYNRVTDGQKGPHNKWLETDIDRLIDSIGDSETLTRQPSGIYVTPADARAITAHGYSPVLGTKAVQAHLKAPDTNSAEDTISDVSTLYARVAEDDATLAELVIDHRRQQPPVIRQVPMAPAPAPVIVNVTPASPEPIVVVETPTPVVESSPVMADEPLVLRPQLAGVPPKHLADRYIHRNVLGNTEDFKAFDYARANHINVLIYGPTGPGKTTAVEAWAAERNLRMATVSGNAALEPSHLFGKFISDGRGGFCWVDGPVTDVVRNGGVLLLDEFNFISPKIYTVIYPLTDSRRTITLLDHMGEVIEAHKDLTIFATMNPDYVGTSPLNFAMRNRFDMQIPWDYDEKVESKLVKSKALQTMIKQLRDEGAKGSYETPISTNMLMEFSEFVRDLGYEFAVENFIAHFGSDEQPSIRLVVQTHETNLRRDFHIEDVVIETEHAADQGDGLQDWERELLNTNNNTANPF
jgi:hypothetical protein